MPERTHDHHSKPLSEHGDRHPALNRHLAFRHGFRKGALWSLILAVPVAAIMFSDILTAQSLRIDTETKTTTWITLTWPEIVMCIGTAVAIATTLVTLPWALVTGFIERRRRLQSDNAS